MLLISLLNTVIVFHVPPTDSQTARFEQALNKARAVTAAPGVCVRWKKRVLPPADASSPDAGRQWVASERVLLLADADWRCRFIEAGGTATAWDAGSCRDGRWLWHESSLRVGDSAGATGRQVVSVSGEFRADALNLVSGGMVAVPPQELAWRLTSVTGDRWTARTEPGQAHLGGGGGRLFVAEGVFEPIDGWLLVERLEAREKDGRPAYALRTTGWARRDEGLWAAQSVELVDAGGPSERLELVEARRAGPGEVPAAARVPKAGSPDPFRGPVEHLVLSDERGGAVTASLALPEGMVPLDPPTAQETARQRALRFAGWGMGIGLVVTLFAWWRHRRSVG